MDTLSREVTIKIVSGSFVKRGANSFLLEKTPFRRGLVYRKANKKSQKLSPLYKYLPSVSQVSLRNTKFYGWLGKLHMPWPNCTGMGTCSLAVSAKVQNSIAVNEKKVTFFLVLQKNIHCGYLDRYVSWFSMKMCWGYHNKHLNKALLISTHNINFNPLKTEVA